MPKPRMSLLVGLVAALVIACLATLTLYARQQNPAPPQPVTDVCNCTSSGSTDHITVVHCTCGGNLNCLVARGPAGNVAVHCK
jgi:hypothetical protein